jgi:hypothetical protein
MMINLKSHPGRLFEIMAAFLGFVGLYLGLALFAPGGPISTDITAYMNVGLNGIASPTIMNRYFHVFLEAIFLKTASTPLVGVQHFWAFLIAGTSLLIYISARIFSKKSNPLHGLLAVALFLSINSIAGTAGVAFVDITAMFMVILLTMVYILSARRVHEVDWLIALFGFLFYLAFRTKETTLSAGFLVLGFGFSGVSGFRWSNLLKRSVYLIFGVLGGVFFFAILSWIFLGDPIFGLRIEDIRIFLQTYVQGAVSAEKAPSIDNWYSAFLFADLLIPFSLYLISGLKASADPETGPELRLVWLVPLAEILFVIVTIGNQWGYNSRFVFPILPCICLLGPQFLNLHFSTLATRKERVSAIVLVASGLALIVFARLIVRYLAPRIGWDIGVYLAVVFIPVFLTIILGLAIYWKRISVRESFIISVLLIAILTIPLVHNFKVMVRDHPNLEKSQEIFYPFSAFSGQIHFTPAMLLYIQNNVWDLMGESEYAKDRNEIAAIFNVYFDASSTKENFVLSGNPSSIPSDLLANPYTDALISFAEWQRIAADPQIKSLLEQKYQAYFENKQVLVLLKAKTTAQAIPAVRLSPLQDFLFP